MAFSTGEKTGVGPGETPGTGRADGSHGREQLELSKTLPSGI